MRTVAPFVIIWSARVWKAFLSPWAFWMSDSTPAALNASERNLRSAVSQRTEDLLSGRITPILGVLPPPLLPEPVSLPESSPHAASDPTANRLAAAMERIPLRIAWALSSKNVGFGGCFARRGAVSVVGTYFCCARQRIAAQSDRTRPP